MVNFEEFRGMLEVELKNFFSYVAIEKQMQNNGGELFCVKTKSENREVTPTIYLESFYKDFINGGDKSISLIAKKIVELSKQRMPFSFDVKDFKNFETAKKGIVYRFVNTRRNKKLLEKMPHRKFFNLAICYKYIVHIEGEEIYSIAIGDNILQLWDISEEELFEIAKENTPKLLPAVIQGISDVFPSLKVFKEEDSQPMYVLTNTFAAYGAIAILYEKVLADLANKIEKDLFVIFSSIHDCILIPDNGIVTKQQCIEMVHDVNCDENLIAPEEVLTDVVYYYSRCNDSIRIA